MLRVHCILDCFAHIVRSTNALDFRPLYIGIWDEPFGIGEDGELTYYSTQPVADLFENASKLYGKAGELWYGGIESRDLVLREIDEPADHRRAEDHYFVPQVDPYYLPYPNQSYQLRHRPHYVIARRCDNGEYAITDPYFNWQGRISNPTFREAFGYGSGFSCVSLFSDRLTSPSPSRIAERFEAALDLNANGLVVHLAEQIREAMDGRLPLSVLAANLGQIGVLGYRKNGYAHASAFLAERLNAPIDELNEEIVRLVNGWSQAGLSVIRIGITQRKSDLERLAAMIDELGAKERYVKGEVRKLFVKWKARAVINDQTGSEPS